MGPRLYANKQLVVETPTKEVSKSTKTGPTSREFREVYRETSSNNLL